MMHVVNCHGTRATPRDDKLIVFKGPAPACCTRSASAYVAGGAALIVAPAEGPAVGSIHLVPRSLLDLCLRRHPVKHKGGCHVLLVRSFCALRGRGFASCPDSGRLFPHISAGIVRPSFQSENRRSCGDRVVAAQLLEMRDATLRFPCARGIPRLLASEYPVTAPEATAMAITRSAMAVSTVTNLIQCAPSERTASITEPAPRIWY